MLSFAMFINTVVYLLETVTEENIDRVREFIRTQDGFSKIHNYRRPTEILDLLARLNQKPFARGLVLEIIQSAEVLGRIMYTAKLSKTEVKPYTGIMGDSELPANVDWFLNVVLVDALSYKTQDYGLAEFMGSTLVFNSDYEYYVLIMDYAHKNSIPSFEIMKVVASVPNRLDYFMMGTEYETLFMEHVQALSTIECGECAGILSKTLLKKHETMNNADAAVCVRNSVYLHRRLIGYACTRVYGSETDEAILRMIELTQQVNREVYDRAAYEYAQEHPELEFNGLDHEGDFLEAVMANRNGELETALGPVAAAFNDLLEALIEEEPRYVSILL
jgi:predicted metal-binding protein